MIWADASIPNQIVLTVFYRFGLTRVLKCFSRTVLERALCWHWEALTNTTTTFTSTLFDLKMSNIILWPQRPILCSCACYCYWNQSIDLLYEEVPINISLATICPKIKIWKYVTFFYKVKKIDAGSLWPTKATQIEDGLPVLRLISLTHSRAYESCLACQHFISNLRYF